MIVVEIDESDNDEVIFILVFKCRFEIQLFKVCGYFFNWLNKKWIYW